MALGKHGPLPWKAPELLNRRDREVSPKVMADPLVKIHRSFRIVSFGGGDGGASMVFEEEKRR